MKQIPVCEPLLAGNEEKYVLDCIKTGWISSSGKYIEKFEKSFAKYCDVKYAVAVSNGTVALHLSLIAAGIKKGDHVIIPNFTMIATAFAVVYIGAIPIFVDADVDTWNMNTELIEDLITDKVKAIICVSIFGTPCDMDSLIEISQKYNLILIEDAAESHGATYKERKIGSITDVTSFSFYSNKNLTTGEGGIVVTNDLSIYNNLKYYKNLCFSLEGKRNYIHEDIGFNYRMSNLHAAIGLAQVEKADYYKQLRIKNGLYYRQRLSNVEGITLQKVYDYSDNVYWVNGILINPDVFNQTREELIFKLSQNGIDTRLFFNGMNMQPSLKIYSKFNDRSFPVTKTLQENGLYLPSGSNLSKKTIDFICDIIIS